MHYNTVIISRLIPELSFYHTEPYRRGRILLIMMLIKTTRCAVFNRQYTYASSFECMRCNFSFNSQDQEAEDLKLHKEFYNGIGKMSKFEYFQQLGEKRKKYFEEAGFLMPKGIYLLFPLPDIYNPLLQKYKFDLESFGDGVRNYAFPEINDAISYLEKASANPALFSDDEQLAAINSKKTFLKEQMKDKEYAFSLFRIRTLKETNRFQRRVAGTIAPYVFIESIRTRIVGTNILKSITIKGNLSNEDRNAFEEKLLVAHKKQADEDIQRYGKGSVVASIRSMIWTVDGYANSNDVSSLREELWTMEACISGQVPMNWTVSRIIGPTKADLVTKLAYKGLKWVDSKLAHEKS